ncbi:hypothetical protein FMUND_14636 [Fusarium mundagurra]|uniref:Uncharacterized protein n=1 Tax=Fusarium mundagurra TaxID=1567541 RepID=A0A8H6D1C0_9HYPO|nr:hypothetical protein FMUND_14636 [Fusarium mundagurra]
MASAASDALDDISFWNNDGFLDVKNVTKDQWAILINHLWERYHVIGYLQSMPFLVMECDGGPPHDPPFSVAGAIAIWRDAKDFSFFPLVGNFAHGDYIEAEDDIVDQIVPMEVPPKDIILRLANLWPECQAITFLWGMLVVELPLVSGEHHVEQLQDLPSDIDGCSYILRYHNGPLANTDSTRAPEFNPGPERPFRASDHKIGDLFFVDYATGVTETVCYLGRRFTFGWKKDAPHNVETRSSHSEDSAGVVKYIAFDQAAFLSNAPKIDMSCETVGLRCRDQSLKERASLSSTLFKGT